MKWDKTELLSNLRNIDEYEFEQFVAELWEKQGWNTDVTQGSNDRGIDIVAKTDNPFPQKHLIQAKRYAKGNKIGSPDIQQYSSLRHQESDSDAVIVVTTSSFTRQAIDSADSLNVKLIDGEKLYNLILDQNAEDIVDKYCEMEITSTDGSRNQDISQREENWAELADRVQSENSQEDTVYDVLSRTESEESSWPRNLIPVSDLAEIRDTLKTCINEVIEEGGQGIIKWHAGDFQYAVVVKFSRLSEWTSDGRAGAEISIEIGKKDNVGEGVDLSINEVSELQEQFDYRLKSHTGGSFTSVVASKHGFEDEFSTLDELSVIEYVIEEVTEQDLKHINHVSVLDPSQFGE